MHLLSTCLSESNVHGLPFLANRRLTPIERFVWLLCIAVSASLATFICRSQWERYDLHPVVLSMETNFLDWRLMRPAVTICYSSFNRSLGAQLIRKYWNVAETDSQFWYYSRLLETIALANYSNLDRFKEFALNPQLRSINIFQMAVELKGSRFLVDNTAFVNVITEIGPCQSTTQLKLQRIPVQSQHRDANGCNDDGDGTACHTTLAFADEEIDERRSTNTSTVSDLLCSALDICRLEITPGILEPAPLIIFLHHHLDAMSVLHNRHDLLTGHTIGTIQLQVDWTVAGRSVAALTPKRRQCRYRTEPPPAHAVLYPVYTRTVCQMGCRVAAALRLCACVPFFYATMVAATTVLPQCSVHGLYCLSQHADWFDVAASSSSSSSCECADECESMAFVVAERTFFEIETFTRKLNVEVTFPKNRIRRNVVFSIDSMIVSLGGAAAFCLGCSFISLAEFVYFALEYVTAPMVRRITTSRSSRN